LHQARHAVAQVVDHAEIWPPDVALRLLHPVLQDHSRRKAPVQKAERCVAVGVCRLERASVWIANISLRPGQIVTANQPLFWRVNGNFKETDLQRIRPGQPVAMKIDMYPGMNLTGTVESVGYGSGAVFSLLPSQYATGDRVKDKQRFCRAHRD